MRLEHFKIISGGQTGVDRAALLDAALETGVTAGGWCPEGRKAEDGVIAGHYPLKELPSGGYIKRTKQNVIDSDATLLTYFEYLSGGTEKTLAFCIRHHKPYLLIDASMLSVDQGATMVEKFVEHFDVSTLNVAGPRASSEPRGYGYTLATLQAFIQKNIQTHRASRH